MNGSTQAGAPTAPGYYLDVPAAEYHAGPGVSKSQLDHVHLAPALLQWSRTAPRDEDARAAVDLGDAFHAMSLEPDRFNEQYAVEFQPPRHALVTADDVRMACEERGIACLSKDTKQALVRKLLEMDPDAPVLERLREQWEGELDGRRVLTAAEYRKLQLMRDSAMAHPTARMLLEAEGDVESSIYWIDPETGMLCRCRNDKLVRLPNGLRFLVDVKMTADIDGFGAAVEEYRYHVQDAFYTEGHERHFGAPPDGFVFIAVSNTRDAGRFPVRVFGLSAEDKLAGRNEFRADLNAYAECVRSGQWPGVETVTRPAWARRAAA
jgi:exodeoxyribonuclease VIII